MQQKVGAYSRKEFVKTVAAAVVSIVILSQSSISGVISTSGFSACQPARSTEVQSATGGGFKGTAHQFQKDVNRNGAYESGYDKCQRL
jgi:hypothetical protein